MRGKDGRFVKVTRVELRPCTRGKNKRGVCAHKRTKRAKRAKKQFNPMGGTPSLRESSYSLSR